MLTCLVIKWQVALGLKPASKHLTLEKNFQTSQVGILPIARLLLRPSHSNELQECFKMRDPKKLYRAWWNICHCCRIRSFDIYYIYIYISPLGLSQPGSRQLVAPARFCQGANAVGCAFCISGNSFLKRPATLALGSGWHTRNTYQHLESKQHIYYIYIYTYMYIYIYSTFYMSHTHMYI